MKKGKNKVDVLRTKVRKRAIWLFVIGVVVFSLSIICEVAAAEEIKSAAKPTAKPAAQIEQKSQDTEKSAPEKKDSTSQQIAENIKAIRERATEEPLQLIFTGTDKAVIISSSNYISGGISFDIELRVGRKSLFSFRGKTYRLELTDSEGDGIVDMISFSYKDNSEYGSKEAIRRSYKTPFTPAISKQSARMFNFAVDYAIDGSKVPRAQLFEEFDLQKFFDECVKISVLERLKQ